MLEDLLSAIQALTFEIQGLRAALASRPALTAHNPRDRPLAREEAADYLGVHKDTLYRWAVQEGRIAYSRLGDGARAPIRFNKKDLDDFLLRQRIGTVEETVAQRNAGIRGS